MVHPSPGAGPSLQSDCSSVSDVDGSASSGRCYCPGRSERYPGERVDVCRTRPKALVTAAVRGPGLDLLGELADLTLDSWLDQPTLRIYNAEQLAERVQAEGATIAVVESDRCAGPLFDLPLMAVCSCRGDPNNVDVAAATEAGVPVLRAPGRNADAVAELAVALLFAATRQVVAADADVRQRRDLQGRDHPLPALPGLGAGRQDRRPGRPRRRRPGPALAAARAGHGGHRLRPLCRRAHGEPRRAARALGRGLAARAGDPGDDRHDRCRRSSPPCGRAWSSSTRPGPRCTTPTHWWPRSGRARCRRPGLDHFEGESLALDHPLCELRSVVLTPHIGGATYDTESNHTRTIAEDLCRLLAGRPAPQHRQPRSAGPPMTGGLDTGPARDPPATMPARGPALRLLPRLDPENQFFWTSGADGRLRFLRCQDCRTYVHPPSPRCPYCLSTDLAPEAVSGRATVVAYTVNVQQWIPGSEPYLIGLVAIDEQDGRAPHHQPGGRGARRRPRPAWRWRSSSSTTTTSTSPCSGRRPADGAP